MSLFKFLRFIARSYAKIFLGMKVVGKENEPRDRNFIVIANHSVYDDPMFVLCALDVKARFVAKADLAEHKIFKPLAKLMNVITIHRGESDIAALRKTLDALKNGDSIAIFPQGTRMPGVFPEASQAQAGVGLIASRGKVPVLPVTLCFKKDHPRIFNKLTVNIGKPIEYEEYSAAGNSHDVARYVFSKVEETFKDYRNG